MVTPPVTALPVEGTTTPVPLSAAVCGLALSPPLYATFRVVDRDPAAVGLNVTVNVQEALAAMDPPAAAQDPAPEFVTEKSPEFPPVTVGAILVAVVLELFVRVKLTGELDDPTFIDP